MHEDRSVLSDRLVPIINQFKAVKKQPSEFALNEVKNIWPVIKAIDGELITEKLMLNSDEGITGDAQISVQNDILKVAVINRYNEAPIALGLITGFGLKDGAIASTVAHDSHNIIAIGSNDQDLARAVNLLVDSKGGLSAVSGSKEIHLALPIAGLMSDKSCDIIGKEYGLIDKFVKKMGSQLTAPFMTLSFMALLVIPKIKMSDKGMFDAEAFEFYE
jgi:adenine deaminase